MLISSDLILRFIEDATDMQMRSMERAARRGDPSASLLAVGGKDALAEVRNRIVGHMERETYQSMRHAAKAAKKLQAIDRSKSA